MVGIAIGCLMGALNNMVQVADPTYAHAVMIVFGALAISATMFVMVVTRTEHPPAAAMALGLVLNEWDLLTIVVVLAGALFLSVCKQLVLPMLMDLGREDA